MRRIPLRLATAAAAALTALAGGLAAAPAAGAAARGGWEPWPSPSFDLPAGSRCDFPVHLEPVVDRVERHVLSAEPDGTVRRVAYRGALVMRLTNTLTGAHHDADAGGRSLVDYRPDGSQTWRAHGPILLGFGTGAGTLPRDLYTVDGVYTIGISPTGYRTLTLTHGTADPLCAKIA
ncbi:hypothetical protein ABT093_20540 [Kitasatospora sp. NPDC002551]|uniref:hypothetical protein n=1 Tax=unclassified Kitasatospora TaxID=2633591 RepID=UPI00331AA6D4